MKNRLPYEEFDHAELKLLVDRSLYPRKELAAKLGVSEAMLSKILGGQQAPGFDFVSRITRVLRVPASSVFPKADWQYGKWERFDEKRPGRLVQLLEDLIWGKCLVSCCRSMDSFLLHNDQALAIQERELAKSWLEPPARSRYLDLCLNSYPLRRALRQKRSHGQLIICSDVALRDAAGNPGWMEWTADELKQHHLRCLPAIICQ